MKTAKWLFAFFILTSLALPGFGQQQSYFDPGQIDIPYTKYVLDNGLTLIVHEDHKAPIVAVNIWYHVGSKNEKPGRTGFAHLFEHLMFNGSANYNNDYFKAMEAIGATDLNGTTSNDRTNYFENVPTSALDRTLFLESDRMGHMVEAIDQAKLDEQRGVVQNEKRQYDNQPYGRQEEIVTTATFPAGHPYSWTVIGSMDDLNAASLDDVKEWFKTYYGPSNAVLSVAGDVKPEEILEKVKKYFGDIPPGPSLVKPGEDVAKRAEDTRGYYEDRVPEARITMVWNVPQWGTREATLLDLASSILSAGKTSRLYKKLIYDDQIASSAYAYIYDREIAGQFTMQSNVKPGKSVDQVEAEMNEILADLIKSGPTQEELDRVKSNYFSDFLKGIERIGGFGGKTDILASNMVFGGSPDFYKTTLKYVSGATPSDIQEVCAKWLSSGKYTLVCKPFPKLKADGPGVDRSKLPELTVQKPSSFPGLQEGTLKDGLKVVLAERKGIPTIVGRLVMNGGFSTDTDNKAGLASLAMDLLDEGTTDLNALQISEKMQLLGASINAGANLDASYVNFTTLKQTLDPTLDLFADIVMNPSFPQKDFDRLKKSHLDAIARAKASPSGMVYRVLPKVLYGADHPYGKPLSGAGFESTVNSVTLDDVKQFYGKWIRPNNATLVVVGDISMADLMSKLEKSLADWKKGNAPKIKIPEVKNQNSDRIYLINRPESTQSIIAGAYLITPYGQVPQPALTALNNILGGDFVSRLNMNLREDKHWTYGASSFIWDTKAQRPFVAYVSVQSDKTRESIQEIEKELKGIIADNPVTQDEFNRVQKNMTMQLPGMWETNSAVAGSVEDIVKFNLPKDYYQNYDGMIRKLTKDELQKVSHEVVEPQAVSWFVVGDKSKILPALKELGFPITELDADGNVVKE